MTPFGFMAFPIADKRFYILDSTRGLYTPSAYTVAYILSSTHAGASFGGAIDSSNLVAMGAANMASHWLQEKLIPRLCRELLKST